MQHYDTAREILEASLADIEAGKWICSQLATSTIDGEIFGGCFIVEDAPMGCALGLIATHGGHGKASTLVVNGKEWESFTPAYPSEHAWYGGADSQEDGPDASDAVLEARDALIRACGREPRGTGQDELVYGYNDSLRDAPKGAERAAEWFRKALELVSSPVAA